LSDLCGLPAQLTVSTCSTLNQSSSHLLDPEPEQQPRLVGRQGHGQHAAAEALKPCGGRVQAGQAVG